MMQTALAHLSSHLVGISTPAYFYMNEAIETLISRREEDALLHALEAIDGHHQILMDCKFTRGSNPKETLYRLSQASSYHRGLRDQQEIGQRVLLAMEKLTHIPSQPAFSGGIDPSQAGICYPASQIDLSRWQTQIGSAMFCFEQFSTLPEVDDHFHNFLDWFYPPLHWMIGALIAYGGIEASLHQNGAPIPESLKQMAAWWFRCVLTIFEGSRGTMREMLGRVTNQNDRFFSPDETLTPLSQTEGRVLLEAIHGIDAALETYHQFLSRWTGRMAKWAASEAFSIRTELSTPLVEKLRSALSNPPPAPKKARTPVTN